CPFPTNERRGCPRVARAGAVCSEPKVPINKERFANIYKVASRLWMILDVSPCRAHATRTPALRATLLTKEGAAQEPIRCTPEFRWQLLRNDYAAIKITCT